MTLTTTVGGASSDSYIGLTEADSYHEARGRTTWVDGDDDAKEAALRIATTYIDGRFRGKWKGTKAEETQALSWPRVGVIDEGFELDEMVLPIALEQACAEAAFREFTTSGTLFPDLDRLTKSERVGPLAVEYIGGADPRAEFTFVNDLLGGLLASGSSGGTSFLLRA
jgi:hypothetical protein